MRHMEIRTLVEDFATKLARLIEVEAMERARQAVVAAFASNGKPPAPMKSRRARKKAPIQFCPVPGCKNRAAPVFGMVCADHKGMPKAKIKKFREARRAAKAKA